MGMFGLMVLLVLGGMAAFAYFLSQVFDGGGRMAALVWFTGCGLSLALPMLAAVLAFRVFRGVATPIADVMSATDAIAAGDLSIRVPEPERGPGDFRRLAKSFNRMTAELEQADRQRRNLTADVAHELRTPLHIIQGNLEGIQDGVYQPTPAQIDILLTETQMLTRLVADLQTLSLAEAGQLTLKFESVDIAELLTDIATSFSGQSAAAGIELTIETTETNPVLTISADAYRLNQIISNLVANALQHTPTGGKITLGTQPTEIGVQISVQDSGEGISSKNLPFIFDRFWKGDRSRSRTEGAGSGLGLAITRQLVQAHGGVIAVDSTEGEGTIFKVELPSNRM
jgi:signal transduction histidine kinase